MNDKVHPTLPLTETARLLLNENHALRTRIAELEAALEADQKRIGELELHEREIYMLDAALCVNEESPDRIAMAVSDAVLKLRAENTELLLALDGLLDFSAGRTKGVR